jgi:hypothetical protein
MHRTLSIVVPSLVLALAAGCVDSATPGTDGSYLFGLSADQILAAKRVAHTDLSDAAWLALHQGEFDCARYGDLCRDVGRDAAYRVIELGYLMAIDGADRAAIGAAQGDAIADARAARPVVAEPELWASTTGFFTGGSNSHRLKIVASATEMWPSLELRATGECVTQRNSFGWLPAASDSITGTMTATFSGLGTFTDGPRSLANGNTMSFGPFQHDANHLTVTVACSAREEGWSASGSVTQTL